MPSRSHRVDSNLFMVRVWLEDAGDGSAEWRGRVQRVISGETLYFRDWATLLAFLQGGGEQRPGPAGGDAEAEGPADSSRVQA